MKLNIYYISNQYEIEDSNINRSSIKECYDYLKSQPVVSIDIETTQKFGGKYTGEGLSPFLSKIVMLQIGTKERQFVIDYRNVDITGLIPLLEDHGIIKVGHNLKFEYVHLLENIGVRITNLYDTMLAERILFNGFNLPNSLKDLNNRYLGIEVDKTTRLEFLTIKDRSFTKKQIEYGAEDVLYPLLIRDKQLIDCEAKKLKNCFNLEFKFLECVGDIEYNGMHFDQDIWKKTYEKNFMEYSMLHSKLDNFVISNYDSTEFIDRQLNLFDSELKCNIQWTSSKQVIKFFTYLGICPMEKSKTTKKLSYTVEAKVLKSSLNGMNSNIDESLKEFINTYLQFKKTEQSCTTFGIDFFKYINPITNRLHSNYTQIINTGRSSSSNPNLQNIPSELSFRKAFSCRRGWKIVNADYSGQETVILANKSKEPNIINLINTGGDMHAFVTKALHPELTDLNDKEIKTLHGDKRQVAKAAGFAVNL